MTALYALFVIFAVIVTLGLGFAAVIVIVDRTVEYLDRRNP